MKKFIKGLLRKIGIEVERYSPNAFTDAVVTLDPETVARGNVLLSYIIEPFLLKPGEPVPLSHNNYWRSLQMAKTFCGLGYRVDVIDYRNNTFIPERKYSFFIDVRWNMERLAPLLNRDCVKVMHIDTAHMLFHNAAECNRLLDLQQRKGFTLRPRRFEMPNLAIEHADCATIAANEFTINTFTYAKKPIYRVPQSPGILYPWPEDKDFDISRRNYLWFNSGGFVHKGLDLVLEAFAGMPDNHLYICAPLEQERDFEAVYYKELYETPNIHVLGWVDVSSGEFLDLAKKCNGIVCASSSEGGGGSIITCMHAGLIPVVSYESSVDVKTFGVLLPDCSVETIRNTVNRISGLPEQELKNMARSAWEHVRAHHTRERFAEDYKKVILKIQKEHARMNDQNN